MTTVILFLIAMTLIFTGSYYWALLALFMAISVRFTLIVIGFAVVLLALAIATGFLN
jgi:hypothetical protein